MDLDMNSACLTWNKLSVWCKKERSWSDVMRRKSSDNNYLIHEASGRLESGDFVMLLGPSGAGKTTFMVALAGKSNLPRSGYVELNGVPIGDVAEGSVEIIPQQDLLMGKMTVNEHVYFMSEMRFNNRLTKYQKSVKMMNVIRRLGLERCLHTLIEDCSGGQKKLISVAVALLSEPDIIFCDEPTTGLDSNNAATVVGILKELSNGGKIVVCSVHQPSSLLFYKFNKISLLSAGQLIFCGGSRQCMDLFQRHQMECPESFNPAEHFLRSIIVTSAEDTEKLKTILEFKEDYESNLELTVSGGYNFQEDNQIQHKKIHTKARWLRQIYLLLWRKTVQCSRNKKGILMQLLLDCLAAPIFGMLFFGASIYKPEGAQDISGLLYMIVSHVSFTTTYGCISTFLAQIAFYRREADMYSGSAFYLSALLFVIPYCLTYTLFVLLCTILCVTIPGVAFLTFTYLYIILIITAFTAATYGFAIVSLLSRSGLTFELPAITDTIMMTVCGAFSNVDSLPSFIRWTKYFSHFFLGLEAVSNVFWTPVENIVCPYDATSMATCPKTGEQLLSIHGYQNNLLLDGVAFFGDILFWSLLVMFGLFREKKLGYVF